MSRKGQIFKKNVLKTLLHSKDCCIALVPSKRLLALPPYFLNDMKSGIIYLLNSILKKYDRELDGILIGYQNIKLLMDENTGIIKMGTAETEVNVSVEFYIFQPKIGNYLEGVVNKKSNNHIGCLVHKYFNATILKPEDVEYEDWICKDLNINDKIVFKVKDLDFSGLLPYIEGTIDDDELINRLKDIKRSDCNLENNVLVDDSVNEMCSSKNKNCESTESKKNIVTIIKNPAEESVREKLNENVNRLVEENFKPNKVKNKKEKKKKLEEIHDILKSEKKEISCTVPKLVADETSICDVDQSDGKMKKKKMKKQKVDELSLPLVRNLMEGLGDALNSEKEENDHKLNIVIEGENKKHKKKKKEKKDEKGQGEDEEKVNKCLVEEEENIFHSTQLEPFMKNMEMSFCSPISAPQESTSGEKKSKKNKQKLTDSTTGTFKEDTLSTSKKEKSSKNRKKHERDESDERSGSKKLKNSSSPMKNGLSEPEDDKFKSTVQSLLDEIYREQMSRVKEEWGTPDRESSSSETKAVSKKESKKQKKEESLYEKLMKQARTAISFKDELPKVGAIARTETSKRESPFSAKKKENSGKKERKRKNSECPEGSPSAKKLKNGSMFMLESSPEKLREDKSLFSDSESSKASPMKKKKQMNGDVSGSELVKSKVESTTEERIKSEGKSGEKKEKKRSGKSKKKLEFSLYEKLLRDAKNMVNSSGEETPTVNPKKDSKKQKTRNPHVKSLF